MKKLIPILTLSLAAFTYTANAQTDTTKYDLGRISLQKEFTQAVTVKGTDLQKLPFITLSDAVNTWFYGVYGTASYMMVIDGNLFADINAYSIYDIDEVTLVQNSLTQLNGISPSQILVLVKTKRGGRQSRSGVDVNGQINYVNLRNTTGNGKSTGNIYQQYYVSPYIDRDNLKAGLSVDLQRSVMPLIETDNIKAERPLSINRVKLNAYVDLKLTRDVLLGLSVGYVPQTDSARVTYSSYTLTQSPSQHVNHYLWYGNLRLQANISPWLVNRFNAGMQLYDDFNDQDNHTTDTNYYGDYASNVSNKKKNFLIKDDLTARIKAGRWAIEPNVNLTYREFRNDVNGDVRTIGVSTFQGNKNISGSSMWYRTAYKAQAAILTPSLSISLDKAFLVQGGFQYFIKNSVYDAMAAFTPQGSNDPPKPKFYPFISVAANLLRSDAGDNPKTALTVFGSFTKSLAVMSDAVGLLSDGTNAAATTSGSGYSSGFTSYYVDPTYNRSRTYDQLQAGTTLWLMNKKLAFSYNYNVRKDDILYIYSYYSSGAGATFAYMLYPSHRTDLHRVSIDLQAYRSANFSWTTSANFSVAKGVNTFYATGGLSPQYLAFNIGNFTTGGFINRFTYQKFSAGLDMLYRINEDLYNNQTGIAQKGNANSFDLKNIYVAYQLKPTWAKGSEVFVNARNPVQNKQSTVTDNRRYYGFGFKIGL